MIPKYIIQQWKSHAPWQSDFQVEHDLILTRALIDLYKVPLICENLAFRGGTALNKIHINPPARYSEDLDFVLMQDAPVGETIGAIRAAMEPWLGKARWDQSQHYIKLYYRFNSEDTPAVPLRLKIEINAYEIFSVFGYYKHPLSLNNDWYTGNADITTYTIDELLATKLRALYQRLKGRDLFDMWYALTHLDISTDNIIKAFLQYCQLNDNKISRAQFEENLFHKWENEQFRADINSLLPLNYAWDFNDAYDIVNQKIIQYLPGEAWKCGK